MVRVPELFDRGLNISPVIRTSVIKVIQKKSKSVSTDIDDCSVVGTYQTVSLQICIIELRHSHLDINDDRSFIGSISGSQSVIYGY